MAAGLGFKDFVTGEVLTAADVDGYLMQGVWVFASAAARDAAVTAPSEGNFAYLKDTNVTTYYTGSAWANLDTTGMTNPMTTTGDTIYSSSGSTPARLGIGSTGNVLTVAGGVPTWAAPAGGSSALTQMVPSSTANSGGSVSTSASGEVTFTGVTSISLNGVFTSTYTNYLIITDSIIASGNADITMRMRASGSDTTSNYDIMLWDKPFASGVSAPVSIGTTTFGSANWYMSDTTNTLGYNYTNITLSSPQKTISTTFTASAISRSGYQTIGGKLNNSTSYDGFTFNASANNFDGIIRVYGYSK
jgi:hypothetical protein